jgi:hypothetical protein
MKKLRLTVSSLLLPASLVCGHPADAGSCNSYSCSYQHNDYYNGDSGSVAERVNDSANESSSLRVDMPQTQYTHDLDNYVPESSHSAMNLPDNLTSQSERLANASIHNLTSQSERLANASIHNVNSANELAKIRGALSFLPGF